MRKQTQYQNCLLETTNYMSNYTFIPDESIFAHDIYIYQTLKTLMATLHEQLIIKNSTLIILQLMIEDLCAHSLVYPTTAHRNCHSS